MEVYTRVPENMLPTLVAELRRRIESIEEQQQQYVATLAAVPDPAKQSGRRFASTVIHRSLCMTLEAMLMNAELRIEAIRAHHEGRPFQVHRHGPVLGAGPVAATRAARRMGTLSPDGPIGSPDQPIEQPLPDTTHE